MTASLPDVRQLSDEVLEALRVRALRGCEIGVHGGRGLPGTVAGGNEIVRGTFSTWRLPADYPLYIYHYDPCSHNAVAGPGELAKRGLPCRARAKRPTSTRTFIFHRFNLWLSPRAESEPDRRASGSSPVT
jgi:hypothetical protein